MNDQKMLAGAVCESIYVCTGEPPRPRGRYVRLIASAVAYLLGLVTVIVFLAGLAGGAK